MPTALDLLRADHARTGAVLARSASAHLVAARPVKAAPPAPYIPLSNPKISDFSGLMWRGRRLTPDQIRWILESAIAGDIAQQWELFDLMEDTWPRLVKNLNEVRRAAARCTYTVQPYAERCEPPTATAKDRADLASAALENWRPRPGTLELGLEDALFDALDAYGKGLSVLEISWQRTPAGLLPRCAHQLGPRRIAWNEAGNELGLLTEAGAWQPFPEGQFWVGTWRARSGAPGHTALLRCLAPYWCGITFGWEWLLNNAQIFGVPFRWATYDPARTELLPQLTSMLQNLGSAGWAAFPAGTALEFKEAIKAATDNPQVLIQTLADKACDITILGQEASSESKPAGLGSGASALHGAVRADVLQAAAQWCADLLNYQLVPALLRLNWGDGSEPPTFTPENAGESDPEAMARRDQILLQSGYHFPKAWGYKRHAIPLPEEGEETISAPAAAAPLSLPPSGPAHDRNIGVTAPEGGSAPPESESTKHLQPSSQFVPKVDPVEAAASTLSAPLPGDYRLPEATRRALDAAHRADLAPLRRAAAPLLAAIEAGELDVVGKLEAFIAELDTLAPTMVGAGALADALEAALAEAAIAGAAQTYAQLPAPAAKQP